MAIVVEREQRRPAAVLTAVGERGWPAVAAAASIAAGAIHASAIGVHSEHRQAALLFTAVAAVQLGFGLLALTRASRRTLALGGIASAGLVAGWVVAKTSGLAPVAGLGEAEAPQVADGLAAGLAAVVVIAVGVHLLGGHRWSRSASPLSVGVSAVLLVTLAVPGMLTAGTHVHDGHDHATEGAEVASAVPPTPYDPALPIDLGGVEGVTPQQQAAAENLLAITVTRLPRFSDPAVAEGLGFWSIGDGALGYEHYLSPANMADDRLLDPDYPESLVYDTTVVPKKLVAAMFMLDAGDTLADVPELGGKLTQWHVHDNLCFAGTRVAGITDGSGDCAEGLTKGAETPMIHVWIEPHPCGPFSALEGIAAGTIAEGETRLCDHVHGA